MKLCTVSLVAAFIFTLAGCQSEPTNVAAASPSISTPAPAAAAAPKSEEPVLLGSGPIVVENQVDVAAQRDGVVAELLADAGTVVRKGQLLARLDDRQLTADRDAAKAQAASIDADLKNWEATVKMAEVDLDRSEKMFQAKLITASQVEHDRFKLTATKYEYDREQNNLQRAQNVAKSLQLELDKTQIVAPFDGVVARRYVRNGQRIGNGDRLFWVTAISPLHVRLAVAGKYAGSVRRGSALQLVAADMPGEKHVAKVILVSPVIDPASGTLDVTAEITGDTGSLKPGMIANVQLADGHPEANR